MTLWTFARLARIVLAAVVAVALAGCSGRSGGGSTSSAAGSTASSSSSPSQPSSPASSASSADSGLSSVVVQKGDLPSSYTAKPAPASTGGSASHSAFVRCVRGKDTSADVTGEAQSDIFTGKRTLVTSTAARYTSSADVRADVANLHSSKAAACYSAFLRAAVVTQLPPGASITSLTTTLKHSLPGASHVAAVARASIRVTLKGRHGSSYVTVVLLAGHTVEAQVELLSVGAPVSADLERRLAAAVGHRVDG